LPIGSQEKRQSIFLAIEEFSRRRPGAVFLTTFIVVCVAVLLGSQIQLETDILNLVPRGERAVDAFKTALREFGGADFIGAIVEAPPGHNADEYQDYVDLFAEKLSAIDGVDEVEFRLGGDSDLLALLSRHALMFLPPDRIDDLAAKLSDAAIREQVAANRRILETPGAPFLKEIVRADPLGLSPLLWSHLLKGRGALRVNPVDGYYMSQDETALLVIIKPSEPSQNLGFTARLVADIRQAEGSARQELAGEGGVPGVEQVQVDLAGSYILALEDSNLIKGDMKLTGLLSFLGVLGLYYIGYRRFGALLYSSVPLIVGQALTFAVAYLVFRHFNSASSGFVAMTMGLGTDFTIVMYARYVEERRAGRSLAEASQLMMGEGALGMFAGAVTSAGTFYSMCVTRFRGLFEMGFLIGTGILLSMIAILFLLPAMIQVNEGRARRRDVMSKLHIQSFGFERLIPLAVRHPHSTLVVTLTTTLILGIAAWNVGFSDSIRDLGSRQNKGLLAQEKMARKFGGDLNFMIAMVEAPTMEEAVARTRAVVDRAGPFLEAGILRGVDAVASYLPDPKSQRQVLAALRQGTADRFSVDRVESTFRRALAAEGFRDEVFDTYLHEFRASMSRTEPIGLDDLRSGKLDSLLERYVVASGSGYHAAVYLFTEEGKWRRDAPPGLIEALQAGDSSVSVTGVNVVSRRLREIFAHDAKIAIGVGLILVSFLLWLDFRSLEMMLLANAQVLAGVIWMLGVMSLTGVQMNFVNCFVATMILGVGVDYGIHLIHRMRLNGGVVDDGVLQTGKAVAMAALTNVVGFGSLTFSNYPALRSVGIISSVGSVACLLTALTLLPAILSLRGARLAHGVVAKRPSAEPIAVGSESR